MTRTIPDTYDALSAKASIMEELIQKVMSNSNSVTANIGTVSDNKPAASNVAKLDSELTRLGPALQTELTALQALLDT